MSDPAGPLWLWRAAIDPTDVYDGDTLRCTIDRGFHDTSHRRPIRLAGIDTPELRGTERQHGLQARDWVRGWVQAANITGHPWPFRLETVKLAGKYGRIVGTIWRLNDAGEVDPQSLNEALLVLGLAEEYPA